MNINNGVLVAPERNNFFYGKLMDVAQFQKEQDYFNQMRSLLNRLVVGSGVVCGLDVVAAGEMVTIQPGMAIDGWGREIIVAQPKTINPRQLTDDHGNSVGNPGDTTGTVGICLAYAETCADLVPALVPGCDGPGNCAHSTIRESAGVLVRLFPGGPPDPPPCSWLGGFPEHVSDLQNLLRDLIRASCSQPSTDPCVPLARVTLGMAAVSVDARAGRSLVYNNRLLYETIVCLAKSVEGLTMAMSAPATESVEEAAQTMILRYAAGDGQNGRRNELMDTPLVVELVDGEGKPIADQPVQFEVTAGGGTVKPATKKTTQRGLAQTRWTLGPEKGEQQVTATAEGTNFAVTFRATAV